MKKHHFKLLSFLFIVGLMVAGVLATYVATTGTGGFMTRAAKPFDCSGITYLGKKFCNAKNLCKWRDDYRITTKGSCISKVNDLSKDRGCANMGAVCCTNVAGQGYCNNSNLTCNPTDYTCVAKQAGLGQERGLKGTCSKKFKGATCKWTSECTTEGGIVDATTLGYCQGPAEWRCCKPKPAETP